MPDTVLDIGCGPSKCSGATGIDRHPYPGVDIVHDLDRTPWPLTDASYDHIVCSHVIEHIADPVAFLREVHRVARPGALVQFITPHFSSIDSWADPTHRWHLASGWHETLRPGMYLAAQTGAFELVSSRITFGKSLRSLVPRAMVRLGAGRIWEKHYAFIYPARNIEAVLKVLK